MAHLATRRGVDPLSWDLLERPRKPPFPFLKRKSEQFRGLRHIPKLRVAGLNPVSRPIFRSSQLARGADAFVGSSRCRAEIAAGPVLLVARRRREPSPIGPVPPLHAGLVGLVSHRQVGRAAVNVRRAREIAPADFRTEALE